jgi:hypothetical protein
MAIVRYIEPLESPFILSSVPPYIGQCLHTGSAFYRHVTLWNVLNIIMYLGLAWLLTTSPGLDEWIYWHFFTVTNSYDSSQSMTVDESLHSSLHHERLLFHCDEWRMTAAHWSLTECWMKNLLNSRMNSLSQLQRTEQKSPPPKVHEEHFMNALSRKPCVNSEAKFWFLSVHNFQFSYLWNQCSVISPWQRISLFVS